MYRLIAALICAATPALADPLHYSLSAGAGHSHSLLGLRLEIAGEHWGGFAAAGASNLYGDPGVAAGARWTSGDRRGLVLSLHADLLQARSAALSETRKTLVVAALTLGYRFRYERFWMEAAAGPAIYFDSHYGTTDSDSERPILQRQTGFGALGGQDNPRWPDVELAFGFEL